LRDFSESGFHSLTQELLVRRYKALMLFECCNDNLLRSRFTLFKLFGLQDLLLKLLTFAQKTGQFCTHAGCLSSELNVTANAIIDKFAHLGTTYFRSFTCMQQSNAKEWALERLSTAKPNRKMIDFPATCCGAYCFD